MGSKIIGGLIMLFIMYLVTTQMRNVENYNCSSELGQAEYIVNLVYFYVPVQGDVAISDSPDSLVLNDYRGITLMRAGGDFDYEETRPLVEAFCASGDIEQLKIMSESIGADLYVNDGV